MKKIILLICGALVSTGSAENLTISPAHILPDYTKITAALGAPQRIFMMGFAVGDFNKDGRLDIVVQTGAFTANFMPLGAQVFLQQPDGTFLKGEERILPNTGLSWDFVAEDFNEDGNLDIVMEDSNKDMIMMLGNGNGTFRAPTFLGLGAAGFFAVAKVDGDSHLDIAAATPQGKVGVFAGNGNASFNLAATLDTQVRADMRFGEIMVGDLNTDGRMDIAVASVANGSTFQPGNLDVFLASADGTFQPVARTPGAAVRRGTLADFNGDGFLDYAGVRGSPEQFEIWIGAGNGFFTAGKIYPLNGAFSYAYGIKAGDVNSDGIQDIIVAGESGAIPAAPLSIFLGNGNGTFRPRVPFLQQNNARPINTGPQLVDFNRDGHLDILSVSWLGNDPATELEAMTIALSNGIKIQGQLGYLVNVERPTENIGPGLLLEASSDLTNWTPLATNNSAFLSGKSHWPFTDLTTGQNRRFYRTKYSTRIILDP